MCSSDLEDLTLKLSGMTTQSQGNVDAGELLDQAKESTMLTRRPSIPPADKAAQLSDVEPSRLIDANGQPDTSGLKIEGGPESQRFRRPGGPSKGFANLFKKKTG